MFSPSQRNAAQRPLGSRRRREDIYAARLPRSAGSDGPRGRTGSGSIAQCGAAGDVRLVRQQSGLALEHRGVDGG